MGRTLLRFVLPRFPCANRGRALHEPAANRHGSARVHVFSLHGRGKCFARARAQRGYEAERNNSGATAQFSENEPGESANLRRMDRVYAHQPALQAAITWVTVRIGEG